jgi:Flp pilus assembly protein TadG
MKRLFKMPNAESGASLVEFAMLRSRRKAIPGQCKSRRDSGVAMVEMAMVLSLLVTLLVGTVTAAIAFSQQNSIENAAREGSRFAATLPDEINQAWLQNVIDVTRAAGVGDLDTTVPGQYICVAFVSETGAATARREISGVQNNSNSQCYDDGLGNNQSRVQVVTGRDSEIQVVFFSLDLDLQSQAAARYERG